MNARLAEVLAVERDQLLGGPLDEVAPEQWAEFEPAVQSVLDHRTESADLEVYGHGPAGERRHFLVTWYRVSDRHDRALGLGLIATDISDRKRADVEARVLAAVGDAAMHGSPVEDMLPRVADATVPELADAVGFVVTVGVHGPASAVAGEGDERDAVKAIADAHTTDEATSLLVGADAAPFASVLVVPLQSSGSSLGVAAFARRSSAAQRLDTGDRSLAEFIAGRVTDVVVNQVLRDLADRTQARLELLAAAGTVVERDLDTSARASYLCSCLVPAFGDSAAVFLYDKRRRTLVHTGGAGDEPSATFGGLSHATDGPSTVATAFSSERALVGESGRRSVLVVPIRADGDVMGVLALADSRRGYDAADVLLGEELARVAGPALSNAQRFEHERLTGDLLQRGLLPRGVPELAGARLAARYVPGTVGLHVGGDWYDAVDVGSDGVILVIGDVVGHGIDAALSMGRFRTALQYAATQTHEPAEILRHINEFMCAAFVDEMATVAVVRYDPSTGLATIASAGHPPPLAVLVSGASEWCDVTPGLPLCVQQKSVFGQAEVNMPAGGAIVLFTDGLVERRGELIDEGLERVVRYVSGPLDEPGEVADRLLTSLLDSDGPSDDVALLVARVNVAGPQLSIVVQPAASELAPMRADVRLWLENLDADSERAEDLVLAVNEAVANAVEHAYIEEPPAPVFVDGAVDDDGEVTVVVRDLGSWRPPWGAENRGRGIDLMCSLVESATIERGDVDSVGTTVTLLTQLS